MKLKVAWYDFFGQQAGYYVYKHNWLWGWKLYDGIGFSTIEAAKKHAKDIKELNE